MNISIQRIIPDEILPLIGVAPSVENEIPQSVPEDCHIIARYSLLDNDGFPCINITYEIEPDEIEEPSQLDRIEAQVIYTALLTDSLLPSMEE